MPTTQEYAAPADVVESPSRMRLQEAIQFLVEADRHRQHVHEIREIVKNWNDRKVIYSGDLKPLNTLIDIGVASPAALEKAIALAENKRAAMPVVKRKVYQKELMQQRRGRMASAIELRELEAGRRFTSMEKEDLEREIQARWQRERAAYIVQSGKLDFKGRNEATKEFWAKVDATLALNLDAARKRYRVL